MAKGYKEILVYFENLSMGDNRNIDARVTLQKNATEYNSKNEKLVHGRLGQKRINVVF